MFDVRSIKMKISSCKEFANTMLKLFLVAAENDTDTISIYIPLKNIHSELECEITFKIKEVENDKTT